MPPFTPDQRNNGGRKMITTLLFNHRVQLSCIQKQVQKSRSDSPSIISPKRRMVQADLKQVLATFQKVQEIGKANKGVVDTSTPFQLKKQVNRSERNFEHEQNLRISRKKIQDLTSVGNRKKNTLDYLLFPTFLFRRKTVSEQNLTPSPLKKKEPPVVNCYSVHQGAELVDTKNENTRVLFEDPYRIPYNCSIKSRKKAKLLPFSTAQLGLLCKIKSVDSQQMKKISMDWNQINGQVHQLRVGDYDEFKSDLETIIQNNGIYSVSDYEKLIRLIQQAFAHVRKSDLIKIFNEIIACFRNESYQ